MKDVEFKLVAELMKNSKRSDKELAKTIGISQPTVSRIRTRLEREGAIHYTAGADLGKLGFEIMAFSFGKLVQDSHSEDRVILQRAQNFLKEHPNIVFFSTGRGSKTDRIAVTVHKNYFEYAHFIQDLKHDWEDTITITDSFMISLGSDNILRPLSLRYLAECLEKSIKNSKS